MYKIAIVNDQEDQLSAISDKVEIKIDDPERWEVLPILPLKNIYDYPSWILEYEISTIIIDEKLFGGQLNDGSNVDYKGHEVAQVIRESNKQLPIFSLTNYEVGEDLKNSLDDFYMILNRNEFDRDVDKYIHLIKKLSANYFDENQEKLKRISQISELIANGKGNEELFEELKYLRIELELPHYSSKIESKVKLLDEIDNHISKIEALKKEIEKRLDNGDENVV